MKIKDQINADLKNAIKELTPDEVSIEISKSALESHGDYSTNVSLILAKKLKKPPMEVAEEIASKLYSSSDPEGVEKSTADSSLPPRRDRTVNIPYIEKVEVAPPGFINFFISKKQLISNLNVLLQRSDLEARSDLKYKKIMVEFTDPNPFKEFHIGHLYSNTVGESISRLLEQTGAEVRRVCYQGDVGMHVAKAIYGMSQNLKAENLELKSLEEKSLEERAKFLGESYALGASEFETNEDAKQEITNLNKKIFELFERHSGSELGERDRLLDRRGRDDARIPNGSWTPARNASQIEAGGSQDDIRELYSKGKAWSLEYFEAIYKRLGTKFEKFYFESEAAEVGLKLVKEYFGKSLPAGRQRIFEESEGAVIFPGKKFGLHNRVFINSKGLPTYEAKELGLASTKYKDYPYDQSIIITGNEVNEYFKVVLKALSLIHPDLAERTKHISHGMVRLPQGKMSSRKGNILTGEWMLNEARDKITQKYENVIPDVAEKVAIGAIKYALLKSGIGKNIEFSFDESISLEGNSGPYLQYTFARTRSVLAKSKVLPPLHSPLPQGEDRGEGKPELEPEELSVLRALIHYPEVVKESAEKFAPNLVCNYLFDLAQKFNLFYQKHTIIGSDQEEFRLSLTQAVSLTLTSGITLLGISVVEKM